MTGGTIAARQLSPLANFLGRRPPFGIEAASVFPLSHRREPVPHAHLRGSRLSLPVNGVVVGPAVPAFRCAGWQSQPYRTTQGFYSTKQGKGGVRLSSPSRYSTAKGENKNRKPFPKKQEEAR